MLTSGKSISGVLASGRISTAVSVLLCSAVCHVIFALELVIKGPSITQQSGDREERLHNGEKLELNTAISFKLYDRISILNTMTVSRITCFSVYSGK